MPFYYPNWINEFWRIIGLIHFGDKNHFCIQADKRFDEPAIRAFCAAEGLAFYDTACEVRRLRDNASDAFLEVVTPTDIPALLARIPACRHIVVTGEKAAQTLAASLGCPPPPVGSSIVVTVPAPPIQADGEGRRQADGEGRRQADGEGRRQADGDDGRQADGDGRRVRLWRMPSTSRAYPLSFDKKAATYQRMYCF